MKKWFIAAFFFVVGMTVYGRPSPEPSFNWYDEYRNDRSRYGRYDGSWYDSSLEILNDQIRRDPNDSYAYVNRGSVYFGLGDFERAFADYNKAIELDPTLIAYASRGSAYYRRGDYDKSIADYTYVLSLASNDGERASSFYALSVVYADKGDQEQAEKNLNEAIRLNPNYGDRGALPWSGPSIDWDWASIVNIPKAADRDGFGDGFGSADMTLVNTYTIDMDELESLDISRTFVEVLETDGEDVILKEFMQKNEPNLYMTFKNDRNTLSLSGKREYNISSDIHKVELYVPARSVHKLDVLVRTGGILIKNSVENLSIRAQSGAVTVKNFSGAGTFHISSGDFSMEVADMKGDISISMGSRSVLNLTIEENVSCTLDMEISSGFFNGTWVSTRGRRSRPIKESIGTDPEYTLTVDSSSGFVNVIRP